MSAGERFLEVRDVVKHYGAIRAVDGVTFTLAPGEIVGVIGPNGSGKTTLINCISGAFFNDAGAIRFDGQEISRLPAYRRTRLGIARSFQLPRPFSSMSVLENLIVPLEYVVHRGSLHTADTRGEAMEILTRIGLADKVNPALLESASSPSTFYTAVETVVRWSFSPQVEPRLLELATKRMAETRPSVLYGDFLACDAFDVIGRVASIRQPSLILCGVDDQMTPVRYAQFLADGLPRATLKTNPNAGHMVMLEQPKAVAKALADFLVSVPY